MPWNFSPLPPPWLTIVSSLPHFVTHSSIYIAPGKLKNVNSIQVNGFTIQYIHTRIDTSPTVFVDCMYSCMCRSILGYSLHYSSCQANMYVRCKSY